VRKERDLFRQCLDLCQTEDPAPLLTQTVRLLTELAGAEHGYIEISDVAHASSRVWSAHVGVDDAHLEVIRSRISRGIVAEAMETGQTLHVPDALLDERFSARESVRRHQIRAVLCVPVRAEGISGVVYLQNGAAGSMGPRFAEGDVRCVEEVAMFVGSVAGRLLELIRRRSSEDATVDARKQLRADAVIGRSAALARVLSRIAVVATLESNVLLTGPSGTGKSMLARILHDNSQRATAPFVELNCAALPEALVESELFGAERGAHSGVAQRGMDGKVAAAEGGTLFLDEIGELQPSIQAKLLQFLQSKEYYRLGATKPSRANVRIIAATNRDLETAMAEGTFRQDLYYRLRGVLVAVPSLGERREDVPVLAAHFCAEMCTKNNLPAMTLSHGALAAIEFADWPGNVRQLASRCDEAVIAARMEGATTIEIRHVFGGAPERGKVRDDEEGLARACTFQQFRDLRDRTFLEKALHGRDWNVAQTARDLEMSRSHLNALIRRYDLHRGNGA